jgi:hypothetical protein
MIKDPGTILSTVTAKDLVLAARVAGQTYLNRHVKGDFGDVDYGIKKQNKQNTENGAGKITSQYLLPNGKALAITTDQDKGATIFHLPGEDYSELYKHVN